MKKILASLLALVLLLSCFGMALAEDEKVTLTVWVPESLRITDWDSNNMTVWLEEQGNFELKIETFPSGNDYKTKVNMALMAGNIADLPDVIMNTSNFADADVWEWAQNKSIIPLTEYYADPELAKNINEAMERTGSDYPKQITSPDGNIYGVAMLNQSYGNEYPAKAWYYEPWLKQLGAEIPTTMEELYNLFKKVKETDLNGNGKADEIGMIGTFAGNGGYSHWFDYLMNAFVYAGDGQYRTVNDGTVGLAYTTEEWKEGLKFIRKMFEEGLIASENLTMDSNQFKALMNNEDVVAFTFVYAAPDMVDAATSRMTDYKYMGPVTGPNGVNTATYAKSTAGIRMLVTANCKHPEAAFKLGDLMSCEYIGISTRWGLEGQEWDYIANVKNAEAYAPSVAGFPISIVTYHDAGWWGGLDPTNESWRQTGPFVRQYGIACGVGIDPSTTEEYTIILNEAWTLYQTCGKNPDETIPKLIFTTEESDEISEIQSTLKSFVDEKTAAFLMGNEDIDAGWDAFQNELKAIGSETYLKVVQTVYDRMYK
jgi:putative aldouronate transport system substrate-binding protein